MNLPNHLANVTRDDVLRIIARDFPTHEPRDILAVLDQYPSQSRQPERDRVHLAILRLSGGRVERLQQLVKAAQSDFRDVLGPVENPFSNQAALGLFAPLTLKETEQLLERDRQQYAAWLNAEHVDFDKDLSALVLASRIKRKRGVPGWAGPLLGPALGIAIAATAPVEPPNTSRLLGITVGAILGFLAGVVVWAIDRRLS